MGSPAAEDLTARARIRDAAMWHFGEYGFEGATIRGIAETAGVSSGLVRHHFGSKQALREACDAHLVKTIRRLSSAVEAGTLLNPVAAMGPYQRYLARALSEGGAAAVFDDMVELGEKWITETDKSRSDPPLADPRARATLITAMALSVPVMYEHVTRGLGIDPASPEGTRLLYLALIDVYSHPLLSPEDAASARDALDDIRE